MPCWRPARGGGGKWRAQVHTPTGTEYGGHFTEWKDAVVVENAIRLEHGMLNYRSLKVYCCVICDNHYYSTYEATACCVPESMKIVQR